MAQGVKILGLDWKIIYWCFPQVHTGRCLMLRTGIIATTWSYTITVGSSVIILMGTLSAARSIF